MAIVNDLNKLRDWLQTEVCDTIQLKMPNDAKNDDGYEYELVNPTAFTLYTPAKDRLPPNVKVPVPSVCIRLSEGEHRPREGVNKMKLILYFCTWNPGIHRQDNFVPLEDGAGIKGYNISAEAEYRRSADGWQDCYSFMDKTLRAIESAEYLADMRVVAEDGIKYGMASTQDGFIEDYPYWWAWIEFSVQAGNIRARSYDEFL